MPSRGRGAGRFLPCGTRVLKERVSQEGFYRLESLHVRRRGGQARSCPESLRGDHVFFRMRHGYVYMTQRGGWHWTWHKRLPFFVRRLLFFTVLNSGPQCRTPGWILGRTLGGQSAASGKPRRPLPKSLTTVHLRCAEANAAGRRSVLSMQTQSITGREVRVPVPVLPNAPPLSTTMARHPRLHKVTKLSASRFPQMHRCVSPSRPPFSPGRATTSRRRARRSRVSFGGTVAYSSATGAGNSQKRQRSEDGPVVELEQGCAHRKVVAEIQGRVQ